jgi:hypothetical protein
VLVAWKSVLQISMQDIGQLTDFSHGANHERWKQQGGGEQVDVA